MKTILIQIVLSVIIMILFLGCSENKILQLNADLLEAAWNGEANAVTSLLDQRADVSAQDKYGATPCSMLHTEVTQKL